MALDLHKLLSWPVAFAVLFLSIPVVLSCLYPSSFWANTDYEPLGLADAVNLAYRIADHHLYPARGMMDHPGVPFYFMSWLALALTGYPVASAGSGFFAAVIEDVERYHQISIWLGALAGATGVYLFARATRNLAPCRVVAAGLIIWLASTPATLLMFMSPSIDSFAILINGLFFLVLVRLANDRDVVPSVTAFSASVGAFAYLNKLSYIYIALALSVTGILNLAFRKSSWTRGGLLCILFVVTFLLVVITVGFTIIGREGFHDLIEFHKHVFRGSGIYGTGDEVVVSGEEVWRAIAAIPADKAYAMFIALLGGAFLFVGGFATGLRGSQYAPVAIIGIGAGLASAFSAIIVLKHYKLHYTAGVSATLPSSLVAGYLLIKSSGYRPRITWAALAAVAILFMAAQTMPSLISELALRTKRSELAKADKEDIRAHLAGNRRLVEFVYRAPFAEYGEGFVVTYGSVPRLTDAYLQNRANAISSVTTGLIDREVGIYVLDKNYFPTADSVRTAPNIALLAPKTVTMEDGDKLIELRTTFLLIRR